MIAYCGTTTVETFSDFFLGSMGGVLLVSKAASGFKFPFSLR